MNKWLLIYFDGGSYGLPYRTKIFDTKDQLRDFIDSSSFVLIEAYEITGKTLTKETIWVEKYNG